MIRVLIYLTVTIVTTAQVGVLADHINDRDCVDRGIWLIGSYRCALLLDPNDSIGFYNRREYFCGQGTVQCCKTCETVKQLEANRNGSTGQTTSRPITPPERSTKPPTTSGHSVVTHTDTSCVDDLFWLADTSFPCSDLLNPGTISGGYNKRRSLCQSSLTNCCRTCRLVAQMDANRTHSLAPTTSRATTSKVSQQTSQSSGHSGTDTSCVDDHFWLADTSFPCSDLLTPGTISGGYNKRRSLCQSSLTNCCHTCRLVAQMDANRTNSQAPTTSRATTSKVSQQTSQSSGHSGPDTSCVDDQFWLADTSVPCSDLLTPGTISGGYNKRHSLCQSSLTNCCHTCRLVAQMDANRTNSQAPATSRATTSKVSQQTSQSSGHSGPDTSCVDDQFWLADTSVPCSDLLTPGTVSGGYNKRHSLCQSSLTNCCHTCRLVAQIEAGSTSHPTQSRTSAPATTQTPGSLQCEDSMIVIENDWFPCSTLLDPSFTRIYRSRRQFCQQNGTVCCPTCKTVIKLIDTKPIVKENYVIKLAGTSDTSSNEHLPVYETPQAVQNETAVGNDATGSDVNGSPSEKDIVKAMAVVNEGVRKFNDILSRLMATFNRFKPSG